MFFNETAETRNSVYRFGIAKEQGMLHQMAKSAIWQDKKKLSRNTSKKTKTYLLFEREWSESSFEVEMGLCSANLFIIPDNNIHSIWIG